MMNRTFLATVLSLLTFQAVSANNLFVGVDAGKSTAKIDGLNHSGDYGSDISLGLRAGFNSDQYRVYAVLGNGFGSSRTNSYNVPGKYVLSQEKIKYAQLTSNFDYFLPLNDSFKFFAGPHLGLAFAVVEVHYNLAKDQSVTDYGLAYGGQLGAIYDINQNVNIEAGYNHSWTTLDPKYDQTVYSTSTGNPRTFKGNTKIDNVNRLYLSVNYRF
jgi:hypothetical protein